MAGFLGQFCSKDGTQGFQVYPSFPQDPKWKRGVPLGYHPGGPGFLICSRPAVVEERSKCSSGRTDAVLGSEPESPAQFSLWSSRPICKAAYKTFHLDVSQNPHIQLVPMSPLLSPSSDLLNVPSLTFLSKH